MIQKLRNNPHAWQVFCFLLVGGSAAITNFIVLVAIVEISRLNPLIANIIAYIIAFQVSYWGHRFLTFGTKKHSLTSLPRFVLTSLCGFIATQALFAICLHVLHWYYIISIIITLIIVALATFFVSKWWAFR